MNQAKQNQDQQAEPQIIIKGGEIREFEGLLNDFPHSVSKKLIAFINNVQSKRNQERFDEQQRIKTAQEWTNMNETLEKQQEELKLLRNFKTSHEGNIAAAKPAIPSKLNSDEGEE